MIGEFITTCTQSFEANDNYVIVVAVQYTKNFALMFHRKSGE